jgi:hypothetical protein
MRLLSSFLLLTSLLFQRERTGTGTSRLFQRTLRISSSLVTLSLYFGSTLACEHHRHETQERHQLQRPDSAPCKTEDRQLQLQALMRSCGTISPTEEEREAMRATHSAWEMARGPLSRRTTVNYTIPVYVHVLAANETTGVVNSTQIDTMLSFVNNVYQKNGVPFYFNLTGTDVIYNETYFNCQTARERDYKVPLKKGGSDTVNLYLCDLCPGSPCQMGYSTYPSAATSPFDGIGT